MACCFRNKKCMLQDVAFVFEKYLVAFRGSNLRNIPTGYRREVPACAINEITRIAGIEGGREFGSLFCFEGINCAVIRCQAPFINERISTSNHIDRFYLNLFFRAYYNLSVPVKHKLSAIAV